MTVAGAQAEAIASVAVVHLLKPLHREPVRGVHAAQVFFVAGATAALTHHPSWHMANTESVAEVQVLYA